jgi:hypothetical protein
MADTMDRRAEGKEPTNYRRKSKVRKALGLCSHCGENQVQNRSYCYACTDLIKVYSDRSIVRRTLLSYGLTPELLLAALNKPQKNAKVIVALKLMLESVRKRISGRDNGYRTDVPKT